LATVSIRKVMKALGEVRKQTAVDARICLVGSPDHLSEIGRMLAAGGSPDALGSAFDVLQPAAFPLQRESLQRWSLVVFLEDAAGGVRPDLRASVAVCRAVECPVIVAIVRDTEAVVVDRAAWSTEAELQSSEFVIHTRGTPAAHAALAHRIAARVGDRAVSLAAAVPALRPAVVDHIIESTARQNAAVGVLVFIPGADMPVMTLNQIKMVLRIGAAYGQQPSLERAVEMLGIVATAFGVRALARKGVTFVPGLGWALKGVVGYTATQAMGKTAVAYFERGAPLETGRVTRLVKGFRSLGTGKQKG
jgi:uncharacterized protein (DUF697 family)